MTAPAAPVDTFARNLTAARDAFRAGDRSTALQHAATARDAMSRPQRDRYSLAMLDLTVIRSSSRGAALAADILADMGTTPDDQGGAIALPCHRCQRLMSSPWIMCTPAGEYVPVCDDCARPVVTR